MYIGIKKEIKQHWTGYFLLQSNNRMVETWMLLAGSQGPRPQARSRAINVDKKREDIDRIGVLNEGQVNMSQIWILQTMRGRERQTDVQEVSED